MASFTNASEVEAIAQKHGIKHASQLELDRSARLKKIEERFFSEQQKEHARPRRTSIEAVGNEVQEQASILTENSLLSCEMKLTVTEGGSASLPELFWIELHESKLLICKTAPATGSSLASSSGVPELPSEVVHSDWLLKQGRGIPWTWKRRFAVLRVLRTGPEPKAVLDYYEAEPCSGSAVNPIPRSGQFPLDRHTVLEELDPDKVGWENGFRFESGDEVLTCQAETPWQLSSWTKAFASIQELLRCGCGNATRPRRPLHGTLYSVELCDYYLGKSTGRGVRLIHTKENMDLVIESGSKPGIPVRRWFEAFQTQYRRIARSVAY